MGKYDKGGKGEWEEEEEVCDRGSIGSAHCGVQVVAWGFWNPCRS